MEETKEETKEEKPMEQREEGSDEVQEETETKSESGPYKVFETKEDWQNSIDSIIGSRLKDYRDAKEQLARQTPILEKLQMLCPTDDPSALPELIEERLTALAKKKEEAKASESSPPVKPVEESSLNCLEGMTVRLTPSKMTFKELDEISARVARGEKIYL